MHFALLQLLSDDNWFAPYFENARIEITIFGTQINNAFAKQLSSHSCFDLFLKHISKAGQYGVSGGGGVCGGVCDGMCFLVVLCFLPGNNFDWHICGVWQSMVQVAILSKHAAQSFTQTTCLFFAGYAGTCECVCVCNFNKTLRFTVNIYYGKQFTVCRHPAIQPTSRASKLADVGNTVWMRSHVFSFQKKKNLNIKKFERKLLKLKCAIVCKQIEQIKNSHFEIDEWIWFWIHSLCVCVISNIVPRFKSASVPTKNIATHAQLNRTKPKQTC